MEPLHKPTKDLHSLLNVFETGERFNKLSDERKRYFIAGAISGIHLFMGTQPPLEILKRLPNEVIKISNTTNYNF